MGLPCCASTTIGPINRYDNDRASNYEGRDSGIGSRNVLVLAAVVASHGIVSHRQA